MQGLTMCGGSSLATPQSLSCMSGKCRLSTTLSNTSLFTVSSCDSGFVETLKQCSTAGCTHLCQIAVVGSQGKELRPSGGSRDLVHLLPVCKQATATLHYLIY